MRRALALLVLVLASCSPERFRIVEGPASLTIGATLWTPEASAKVEAGGRAWFGPEPPPSSSPVSVTPDDKHASHTDTPEARP